MNKPVIKATCSAKCPTCGRVYKAETAEAAVTRATACYEQQFSYRYSLHQELPGDHGRRERIIELGVGGDHKHGKHIPKYRLQVVEGQAHGGPAWRTEREVVKKTTKAQKEQSRRKS